MTMHRSRLSKTVEKKSQKRLFLSIVGIVAILFVLIKFGVPTLISFSLFLSNFRNGGTTDAKSSQQILLTPSLNQTFTATNSAQITLSGSATPHATVIAYMNDSLADQTQAKDDGTFTFTNLTLSQSSNTIKVKSKLGSSESSFSDPITILYQNKQLSLSVDNPHDGQTFDKGTQSTTVSGKADQNVRVTINGFWAMTDANGAYSYNLPLQPGDNHITVLATDQAGNHVEKDLTVHLSQ